jgi:hypothetical protein
MEGELSEEDQLSYGSSASTRRAPLRRSPRAAPPGNRFTIGYVDRLSALRAKRQSDALEEFAQLIQKL